MGIQGIPHEIPQKIEKNNGNEYGKPRIEEEPGGGLHVIPGAHEEHSPFRRRRLHADADEGESRRQEDHFADMLAEEDKELRDNIGENVMENGMDTIQFVKFKEKIKMIIGRDMSDERGKYE